MYIDLSSSSQSIYPPLYLLFSHLMFDLQQVDRFACNLDLRFHQSSIYLQQTPESIRCFLESCLSEVNIVGRNGGSLQKNSWVKVAKNLLDVCGMNATQKQMKNHYDYLKAKYACWVYLKNKIGNLYNPETNTFNLSLEEWDDFIKGHPKGKSLKTSPLTFLDLCKALFEGTSITGSRAYTPSSTRERVSVVSTSSFTSHIHTIENEDDEDSEEEVPTLDKSSTNPSNIERTTPTSSRPSKKNKTKVDMEDLAVDLKDALRVLITQPPSVALSPPHPHPPPPLPTVAQIDPVRNACVEWLNNLGLDPMDPLYTTTIDILGHTTLLRDEWLMMTPDPRVLRDWIARTGRRLGFMESFNMLCLGYAINRFIMDNKQKAILVIVVFLYLYYIRSMRLKRKRDNTSRLTGRQFTNELLEGTDTQCIDLLRMNRVAFVQLSAHFKAKGWLTYSKHISVEEKMAIFLMIIGHNQRYRVVKNRFQHSTQTIHKFFHEVLDKMIEFAKEMVVPTSFNPLDIPRNNRRLRRIFKGAIGALDGTLIHAVVPIEEQHLYRRRGKGDCYQNVLAVCDFNMVFTFVVAGWEGVAHDSRVLSETLADGEIGFPIKYYLCDAAYANTRGFMAPYRNVRYWPGDFRRQRPSNKYEMFNHSHAELRNVIERAFSNIKKNGTFSNISLEVQRDVVIACFAVHNFIRKEGLSDELFSVYDQPNEEGADGGDEADEILSHGNAADQSYMAGTMANPIFPNPHRSDDDHTTTSSQSQPEDIATLKKIS
ncbi:hypothetical protein OSB04_024510 [Centaurea solstitialis]|uniref:Transposase n=1 Tax=Centaurea solstitialis TaxID=347529 RepID=A0AA38STR6_9ASTR|nr:hypothetical protein OSB04_024510 [Centaurea solstitialis]